MLGWVVNLPRTTPDLPQESSGVTIYLNEDGNPLQGTINPLGGDFKLPQHRH